MVGVGAETGGTGIQAMRYIVGNENTCSQFAFMHAKFSDITLMLHVCNAHITTAPNIVIGSVHA